ncbi:hypothetical protein DIPPA_17162 [Diplonema papillatum]|nr:hypothetical protein DIPPA_17162 [Diplonema papillatum]
MLRWLDNIEAAIPGKAAQNNVLETVLKTSEVQKRDRQQWESSEGAERRRVIDAQCAAAAEIRVQWLRFRADAWAAAEEPAARSREEAAEDAARSRLQAAIELAIAEGAARDVTAADEQTDRQRLEGEEKASPAHAAFAVHRLAVREASERAEVAESEQADRESTARSLAAAVADAHLRLQRSEEEVRGLVAAEAAGRADAETAEREGRASIASDRLHSERRRLVAAAVSVLADEAEAARAALEEELWGLHAGVHFAERVGRAGGMEEDGRALLRSVEEQSFAAFLKAEVSERKRVLRAAKEQVEHLQQALAAAADDEHTERARIWGEEDGDTHEMLSLFHIFRAAVEAEAETKKSQSMKALGRECRRVSGEENDGRVAVVAAETSERYSLEDAEYVGRGEATVMERSRAAESARALRLLCDTEAAGRRRCEDDSSEAMASAREAFIAHVGAYHRWLHDLDAQWTALFDLHSTQRRTLADAETVASQLIVLQVREVERRSVLEALEADDDFYFSFCSSVEQVARGELVAEEQLAKGVLQDELDRIRSARVRSSLATLPKAECAQRSALEDEEAIFRGSLRYRIKHEPAPKPAEKAARQRAGREQSVSAPGAHHLDAAVDSSLLSETTLAVSPSPDSRAFDLSPIVAGAGDEDSSFVEVGEFDLDNLMSATPGKNRRPTRYDVGQHAQVEAHRDSVAQKCRFSSNGWFDEKANYLGSVGYVQDVSYDCALLYFADERQYWFPFNCLVVPSQSAMENAPQCAPEMQAIRVTRSLWRNYLNTVLPGGDNAGPGTMFVYVGLPIVFFMSIVWVLYYRLLSTV